MFEHCVEVIRNLIRKWKRFFKKLMFYMETALLVLFYIAVFFLLIWVMSIIQSAWQVSLDENDRNPTIQATAPLLSKTTKIHQNFPYSTNLLNPKYQSYEPLLKNTEVSPANQTKEQVSPSQTEITGSKEGNVREFIITGYPNKVKIDDQLTINGWTFNKTIPAPVLRVKEGEQVRIILRNRIPDVKTTIHLHGLPKRNAADGVPLLTQPYVNYGEEYVYEFVAGPAGTYSYHSHGDVKQLDKGMFGPFIIEPTQPTKYPEATTEWIASIDEMNIAGEGNAPPATDGNRMDQSMMQRRMPNAILGTADLYNVFTINGKRDPKQAFKAETNEWVRLRLLNFGFQTHRIKVEGMKMYVTHTDGFPLPAAQQVKEVVISPYERVDVFLRGEKPGEYALYDTDYGHSELGMRAKVVLTPGDDNQKPASLPMADSIKNAPKYQGLVAGLPGPDTREYDRVYNMKLGMTMGSNGMSWAINNIPFSSYEELEPYKVQEGEVVKLNLFNMSPESHPMHLHGHHFSIVSINGQTLEEPWLSKDTVNVRPMQQISIAFKADNPGDWNFHCHQSHHADSGLVTYFSYDEYKGSYEGNGS
ncbi:multicopper oxidase family protein [Radiobacillus kanasensis]|uniref:multicopper oxidase family protein n=1 Tax=Radiobacillus kanasensis TaxID=2844358 RepID=UPI001E365DA8|nr:multicopper oxidase family protein [Radiobacillus kanasensis]UFT98645.1 multicopper oxidase family protein [Radiobacillus kanasensis]